MEHPLPSDSILLAQLDAESEIDYFPPLAAASCSARMVSFGCELVGAGT